MILHGSGRMMGIDPRAFCLDNNLNHYVHRLMRPLAIMENTGMQHFKPRLISRNGNDLVVDGYQE
jgi:hypothetical protein